MWTVLCAALAAAAIARDDHKQQDNSGNECDQGDDEQEEAEIGNGTWSSSGRKQGVCETERRTDIRARVVHNAVCCQLYQPQQWRPRFETRPVR